MAVSIKIRESTKRRLERLQADLASWSGRDLSLQDVLDAAVEIAVQDPSRILGATQPSLLPLSPAARKRVLNLSFDWGVKTTEDDIDAVLYSDAALHGRGPLVKARSR